jgi:hypothetical protein
MTPGVPTHQPSAATISMVKWWDDPIGRSNGAPTCPQTCLPVDARKLLTWLCVSEAS